MPAMPTVTVIVPCYNHEGFVAACLDSIAKQLYPSLQVLVINDGSTDKTGDIARDKSREHGFDYIDQKNAGFIATINRGLSLASGKYICIFASDDVMTPGRLARQAAFLEANPAFAACGGNIQEIDECGVLLEKKRARPERELSFDDIFLGLKHTMPAPTAMIRLDAIRQVGGYAPDTGIEDLYMWLKLTHSGYRIAVLPDVFALYRKSPRSMHHRTLFMLENKLKIIRAYRDHPHYRQAEDKAVLGSLLRAASSDKTAFKAVLSHYNGSWINSKLWRGIFRWLFTPAKT